MLPGRFGRGARRRASPPGRQDERGKLREEVGEYAARTKKERVTHLNGGDSSLYRAERKKARRRRESRKVHGVGFDGEEKSKDE